LPEGLTDFPPTMSSVEKRSYKGYKFIGAHKFINMRTLDNYPYCGHSALMENVKSDWQQVDYVLGFFGKIKAEARKSYRTFVAKGVEQGQRPELTGGGLLRSVGGWAELVALRSGSDWVKSDERIL